MVSLGMEMTAQQLHELYSPLWELVPETRPGKLALADCLVNYNIPAAAALCRVAVEDWLANGGHSPMLVPHGDTETDDYIVNAVQCNASACFRGPTIHHALVAAATEVAKARP